MTSRNLKITDRPAFQDVLYLVTILAVIAIIFAATALVGDEAEVETATPTWVSYEWMPQAEDCSFYVAGPEAGSEYGQPRDVQVIFFRVPLTYKEEVNFRLEGTHLPFDVMPGTRARLYGGRGAYTDSSGHQVYPESDHHGTLLVSKPLSTEHTSQRLSFGPFSSRQGEAIDGWGHFKLVVTAERGNGLRAFRVAAAPADRVESFCFNASLYMDGTKFGRAHLYLDNIGSSAITGITSGFAAGLRLRNRKTSLSLKAPNTEKWIRYHINELASGNRRPALEWMNGALGEGNSFGKRLIVAFTDHNGQPLRLFGNNRIVEQRSQIAGHKLQTTDHRVLKDHKRQTTDHQTRTPALQNSGTPKLQHSKTPSPHAAIPKLHQSRTPKLHHPIISIQRRPPHHPLILPTDRLFPRHPQTPAQPPAAYNDQTRI
ncbi:MAG: hypothetical protein QGG53_02670 [Planctomycetota bacterium]|nr:hypothetical protein [Planctomycetota bacterium]